MDGGAFYRAIWRWHFYAGLVVLPVLALLAVTGALYLYKVEIERVLYHDLIVVPEGQGRVPASRMVAAVEQATGEQVTQLAVPGAPTESWRLTVRPQGRPPTTIFVDPHDGATLGQMHGGGVVKVVKDLHSLALAGPVGNRLVEVVAGWAILLCLTGLYLRWPRAGNRALALRGSPRGRLFWRDLHGSIGIVAAAVILFLAITGMPWTDVWGGGLRSIVAANGWGRPRMASIPWTAPAQDALPWSLRDDGTVPGGSGGVGIDDVMAIAARRGVADGYLLVMPASPGAPWLVATQVARADDARAITIDAGSGAVVQDIDWRHFGPGAKAVEWGIATHQGQQYGEVNRLLMLAGCAALLLLCMTAPVLWWKRRGSAVGLGPPPDAPVRALRVVTGLMLMIGILFPLTGLSMVAALAGEWALRRRRPAGAQ